MRISVLIPTYNRLQQTIRAIDSVLAQTVPVDEIIVVDDGSTDGSGEAIREQYGARVTVVQQENGGVSAARNRGIREAQGDWIAFLDSDDVWLPEKLENQFEAITATSVAEDIGACSTDCLFDCNEGSSSSAFKIAGLEPRTKYGVLEDAGSRVLSPRAVVFVQSLLVRRSLIQDMGGFDEAMIVSEDTDILFRLSLRTKICYVAEPLVQIDRSPFRGPGLSMLYGSREDRVYNSLTRMYRKLLAMPEVVGSKYEQPIRDLMQQTAYSSAESKIHQLRIGPALREIAGLRQFETGYIAIARKMLLRKLEKMRSRPARPQLES